MTEGPFSRHCESRRAGKESGGNLKRPNGILSTGPLTPINTALTFDGCLGQDRELCAMTGVSAALKPIVHVSVGIQEHGRHFAVFAGPVEQDILILIR